jgi:hypothetical protein
MTAPKQLTFEFWLDKGEYLSAADLQKPALTLTNTTRVAASADAAERFARGYARNWVKLISRSVEDNSWEVVELERGTWGITRASAATAEEVQGL